MILPIQITEKTAFFVGKRNKKIEKFCKQFGFEKVFFGKEISTIEEIKKEEKNDYDFVLIKTDNLENMRRMIDKTSNYFLVFVLGMNDKINRAALSHKKAIALVSPEYERKKDYADYRNSGLNQVLCKVARDSNKYIIERLSDFFVKGNKNEKALLLGRIIQNSRLCKEYKANFIVSAFARNEQELKSYHELKDFKKILF
ncbi:MAG: hypothetical protein N3G19_00490 [Candidatus Pacearchaeota archaeon]|nr:hypothetical protein [Candidatus Pacearchaeota archaeon]